MLQGLTDTQDLFAFQDESPLLTVLSFGAGQDSTALLYKYINDPSFRAKYAPNDFLVVQSDTGDEFDETYEHVKYIKQKCLEHGIEFVFLTNDLGYHTGDWQTLQGFYKAKSAIGSKAYPKICSQRLKIDPIYRFLEDYVGNKYGVKTGNKKGLRQFAKESGKIRMIIGIAKNEEKRTSDAADNKARWYRESIEHSYPLIDLGMGRSECQQYIKSVGEAVPLPSNCKMCPFLSTAELEYLRRFEPQALEQWVGHEKRKLDKWSHLEKIETVTKSGKTKIENKNFGVWGKVYLPAMIQKVKDEFADWSDERVRDYRMSHGHCVSTSF